MTHTQPVASRDLSLDDRVNLLRADPQVAVVEYEPSRIHRVTVQLAPEFAGFMSPAELTSYLQNYGMHVDDIHMHKIGDKGLIYQDGNFMLEVHAPEGRKLNGQYEDS